MKRALTLILSTLEKKLVFSELGSVIIKQKSMTELENKSNFRIKKTTFGFTLIELLAVIVIIAIIAIITTPMILGMIDKSKKGSLGDSAYGIITAGELFFVQNLSDNMEVSRYDFQIINGKFVYTKDTTKELSFKGTMPKTGMLQIHTDGKVAIAICSNDYCACKSINELKVIVKDTNCNIDSETGEIVDNSNNNSGGSNPVGTVISYMGKTAPDGYLFCDGSIYNISDYPNLADQLKEEFGSYNYYGGDGVNTFAVPNLQGEFLRGYSSGTENSVTKGVKTEEVGKHQGGTLIPAIYTRLASNGSAIMWFHRSKLGSNNDILPVDFDFMNISTQTPIHEPIFNANSSPNATAGWGLNNAATNYTTRPTNTAVLYCIKY